MEKVQIPNWVNFTRGPRKTVFHFLPALHERMPSGHNVALPNHMCVKADNGSTMVDLDAVAPIKQKRKRRKRISGENEKS